MTLEDDWGYGAGGTEQTNRPPAHSNLPCTALSGANGLPKPASHSLPSGSRSRSLWSCRSFAGRIHPAGLFRTVIITRNVGRLPYLHRKKSLAEPHQSTKLIFLSTGMLPQLRRAFACRGCLPDTPAAIVYKATWKDEKVFVRSVAQTAKQRRITKNTFNSELAVFGR